jgi:hypothetical protein
MSSESENRRAGEEPSRFHPGDLVKWTPRDANAAFAVPLEQNHPGQVSEPTGPWGVAVDWVDREGPLALEGEYDQNWLTPVSREEFDQLSAAVREKRRERERRGREEGRTYLDRPAE